jgi:hypothetical protein
VSTCQQLLVFRELVEAVYVYEGHSETPNIYPYLDASQPYIFFTVTLPVSLR